MTKITDHIVPKPYSCVSRHRKKTIHLQLFSTFLYKVTWTCMQLSIADEPLTNLEETRPVKESITISIIIIIRSCSLTSNWCKTCKHMSVKIFRKLMSMQDQITLWAVNFSIVGFRLSTDDWPIINCCEPVSKTIIDTLRINRYSK